jgi:hypothetical protein
MANESETLACLRCGAPLQKEKEVYALPKAAILVGRPIMTMQNPTYLHLWRCSDLNCRYVELRAPDSWPLEKQSSK